MHMIYNDVMEQIEKNMVIQKHPDKIEHILECALDELKEYDHDKFNHILLKLHKIAYDGKFSKHLAAYAVSKMMNKNKSHPQGEYWSEREVGEIAKKYGITQYASDPYGTYWALNYIYSDYYNPELSEECEDKYYATLAKDFLSDEDVSVNVVNKPFCYWVHIAEGY